MNMLDKQNFSSICLETNFSILSVEGDDSAAFLQSQFTNDISLLDDDSLDHLLCGYCTPKGRLIGLMRILKVERSLYFLIMPTELMETISSRLKLFIIRSKVKIETPQNYLVAGIWNNEINCKIGMMTKINESFLLRDVDCPILGKRAWLIGRKDLLQDEINNRNNISKTIQPTEVNYFSWKTSEFFSGNLWLDKSNTEAYIPQSINLDLNNGVSFSKGCYPGQEIVARTHYLGKIKKRMILAQVKNSDLKDVEIKKNTPIFQKKLDGESIVKIGFVLDFSPCETHGNETDNTILMLIQCQLNELDLQPNSNPLRLEKFDGPSIILRDLPYFPIDSINDVMNSNKSK